MLGRREVMSKHLKTILEKIEKGNTQQEIADQLGISQAAVSQAMNRMFGRIKFCPHCSKPIVSDKDKANEVTDG